MDVTVVVFSVVELAIGLAAAGVAVVAWRYRDRPVGFPLFVMAIATVGYAVVTALRSIVVDPLAWELLNNLRYPLVTTVAVGSFFVMVEFARRDRYKHPAIVAALVGVLLVSFAAALTNPLHELVITDQFRTEVGVFDSTPGPIYWVNIVVSLGIAVAGTGVVLSDRQLLRGVYRKQTLALVAGLSIAVLFAFWQALAPLHPAFDLLTVGIFAWCGTILWGLFRADFLETVPMARKTLVENMSDAVVAVDADDYVIDLNPRAMELFEVDEGAIGADAESVFEGFPTLLEQVDVSGETETEVTLEKDGTTYYFDLQVSPITPENGSIPRDVVDSSTDEPGPETDRRPPRVVVLHDSTERKRYEQQLEAQRDNLQVLNKILRHDVRNDLSIVHGYADLLDEYVADGGEEHLERIKQNATSAIALTTSARNVAAATLDEEVDPKPIALEPVLADRVEEFRSTYPKADVTIEEPLPEVAVRADEMFSSVLDNLLHNAVQHNDKAEPRVWVSAIDQGDSVRLEVADNGPGISDDRKEAIFAESEKGLESEGTGLGLYLVQTLVTQYGGDVWVEDNDPEGSVFVVTLPKADDGGG